jgi:hypothetical protein
MMKRILVGILLTSLFSSCAVVKEYEKVNINDADMALLDKKFKRHLNAAHAYKEAAVGANGGETGGGCGCN